MLQLQRLVGNAATSKALKVATAPVAVTPGGPMTTNELGHTKVRGREMPKFIVNKDGVVSSTTKGSVDIEAEYVAAGTYDMAPNKYGPRKKLITPAMSELVKQGEQEHADDIWFGHEIVAGEAARGQRARGPRGLEGRQRGRHAPALAGSPPRRDLAEAADHRGGFGAALGCLGDAAVDRRDQLALPDDPRP